MTFDVRFNCVILHWIEYDLNYLCEYMCLYTSFSRQQSDNLDFELTYV